MHAAAKYKDVRFFVPFIAFVSAFNYYLTYHHIRLNWFLVWTYILDTSQGLLAWWAMRSIIIYMDKKMPYGQNPLRRIWIQLGLTTFAGMFIIISLTEAAAYWYHGRFAPIDFYTFDILIIFIWFFVINGIYIGMYFYHEWNLSETQRVHDKKIKSTGFHIKLGKQDLLIPFDDIIGFYSEEGFTYLRTVKDKTYLHERSLDKTEEQLPEELFFRLNRQYIMHRTAISGFKRMNDNKLEVQVAATGSIPEAISVSRIRAAQFKKWFSAAKNSGHN
jgi:LytTr DNA-binding domain-containing protein